MLMTRSNLRTRSNVYPRRLELRLKDDHEFSRQARGYAAIRKLVEMMGVPPGNQMHDDPLVTLLIAQGKLTIAQKNAMKWELPCAACNSIPCGLNFNGELEFRCQMPQCLAVEVVATSYVNKQLAAPIAVLKQARGIDFGDALSWAIEQCQDDPPPLETNSSPAMITLRVSSSASARYTDNQLAAFLVYGIINCPQR
jgi:hypothetical protein